MEWFDKKICDLTEEERVYICDKVVSILCLSPPMRTYILAPFEDCIYKCKGGKCILTEETTGIDTLIKFLTITGEMELIMSEKGQLTDESAQKTLETMRKERSDSNSLDII